MGVVGEFLKPLGHSVYRELVASVLGMRSDRVGDLIDGSGDCFTNCTSGCPNGSTCICPCSDSNPSFGAAFASISILLFVIASIQLVLVMVYDSINDDKAEHRWRTAFRTTVQKCLLGTVMLATGTRAIYYTVFSYIPEKWADILLNFYYPAFLSAISLLTCFWAEFFYHSLPADGHDFLKKNKYSFGYFVFNLLLYLLLLSGVIATAVIKDEKQEVHMTGVFSVLFAVLMFINLVAFLHLAIRLFFRPDWQPLSVRLAVLRINLKQHFLSVLGILSNVLMQLVIIALLIFNMACRFLPVDSQSMYIGAVVIRVTELCVPLWFCCSLWNYKHPKMLWILNPSLLLQNIKQHHQRTENEESESDPLVSSQSSSHSSYGTLSLESDGAVAVEGSSSEPGHCWVCHDDGDPADLYYPCKCLLHRKCIKQWVVARVEIGNISVRECLKCQMCREKYRVKKRRFQCAPEQLKRRHWAQLVGALLVLLLSVVGCVYVGVWSHLNTNPKIGIISCVVIVNIVLFKLLGFGLVYLCRKRKLTVKEILGTPVSKHAAAAAGKAKRTTSSSSVVHYQVERQPGAGETTASVHVYSPLDEV